MYLSKTDFSVKQSSPSLVIFENVTSLSSKSPNSLEAGKVLNCRQGFYHEKIKGNKTLDYLCKSVAKITANQAVIFTCNPSDLADLPKSLAQMIHFEFVVPDLVETDRMDFVEFWKSNEAVDIDIERVAALTRVS